MLDVGGNSEWRQLTERQLLAFGPFQELDDGIQMSCPGVGIPNIGGKEIGQAVDGMSWSATKERRECGLAVKPWHGQIGYALRQTIQPPNRAKNRAMTPLTPSNSSQHPGI